MRKLLIIAACLVFVFAGYLTFTTVDAGSPTPAAADGNSFSGTFIVAGMGGHFSVADIVVNPSNHSNPIKIKSLDRIVIGNKKTHPTHDPRIDINDRTKMYWSTYKIDKTQDGRAAHVGLSDLNTGKVLMDKVVQLDDKAKWTGALYCASGQSASSFIPVTMTGEGYIDVFNKSDLKLKKRVFLSRKGYKENYLFIHGTNSPDGKTFALAINKTTPWPNASTPGKPTGEVDMLVLDMKSLERGKAKVLAKNRVTGQPGKTLTFRQTFTPDGKYLLQSAADRMYLLRGSDMSLVDEEIMTNGANHDAVAGPNSKYAILTLRTKVDDPTNQGKSVTDGTIQLYDIEAKALVGKPVSVCLDCHKKMGLSGNAILCGGDANWN